MNLQAADVPGAKVVREQAVNRKGYLAAHLRTFDFAAPNTGAHLFEIQSTVSLAASAANAAKDVAGQEKLFRSKANRKLIIARTAKVLGVKPTAVRLGQPHKVAGYDQELLEVGTRAIGPGVTGKYAGAVARHIATELSPIDVAVPTVTGTPQQGQTLTVAPGTWTAADATFAYQQRRCDAARANCADIGGVAGRTDAVTPADVGTTLEVVVTATNRFGTASAPSAATAVVS